MLAFMDRGGETGALVRALGWQSTLLGSPQHWPPPLKTLVGVMLAAEQPTFVASGDQRTRSTTTATFRCSSVIGASDGPAGLRLLPAAPRVDPLITDVGLPGGPNGRQVANAAPIARPRLEVLFVTGHAENAVVGSSRLDADMALITKPFAMEALAQKVKA